ncbi:MAG: thymidine phosphorylase, partial [Xanthomonadales bacterium]|nr:thymidine phosphorylase [Xanthomonadales bacterium]
MTIQPSLAHRIPERALIVTSRLDIPDLLRRKRDGEPLDGEALRAFGEGVANGEVEDAQIGAFLMAVFLRGMSDREQADLTLAMRDSGSVMRWDDLPGPALDKHSTGGVGDLVSLVLAPLVAACGGFVPMISGRGLGHTGGTLDKLESIPGFDVNLAPQRFDAVVRECGFALAGQGPDLAPADRRLYAVRDVTATVECQPLIVSSILSKKLCEGLDGLVMDIKIGNGAIMTDPARARALGQALCDVAAQAGLACTALLTDMHQPLASSAGNALEVAEALRFLRGEAVNHRLRTVTLALAGELLQTGGLAANGDDARDKLESALSSGEAAERFGRVVAAQGGPGDLLDRPEQYLATAPVQREVLAPGAGRLERIDTRAVGRLVQVLGGGRFRASDAIDPAVGLTSLAALGDRFEAGAPLGIVHAASDEDADRVAQALLDALTFNEDMT